MQYCLFGLCLANLHAKETLALAAARLLRLRRGRLLVRLLRLKDNLLQALTLLVGTLRLHVLHRLLHVREPLVRHFCLHARNKSNLTPWGGEEIPLTS